jgi:hypothetical protein
MLLTVVPSATNVGLAARTRSRSVQPVDFYVPLSGGSHPGTCGPQHGTAATSRCHSGMEPSVAGGTGRPRPRLESAELRQHMQNKHIQPRAWIRDHSKDLLEARDWSWPYWLITAAHRRLSGRSLRTIISHGPLRDPGLRSHHHRWWRRAGPKGLGPARRTEERWRGGRIQHSLP